MGLRFGTCGAQFVGSIYGAATPPPLWGEGIEWVCPMGCYGDIWFCGLGPMGFMWTYAIAVPDLWGTRFRQMSCTTVLVFVSWRLLLFRAWDIWGLAGNYGALAPDLWGTALGQMTRIIVV